MYLSVQPTVGGVQNTSLASWVYFFKFGDSTDDRNKAGVPPSVFLQEFANTSASPAMQASGQR
jgi:hypothetical protein